MSPGCLPTCASSLNDDDVGEGGRTWTPYWGGAGVHHTCTSTADVDDMWWGGGRGGNAFSV